MLAEAAASAPASLSIATEHAQLAEAGGDFEEALRRWRSVLDRFPEEPVGSIACGRMLRQLGRAAEAAALLHEACERFPDSADLAIERCWASHDLGRWEEALGLWRAVAARFPDHAFGYIGLATALRKLSRWDEADAVLQSAMQNLPGLVALASEYATLAGFRADHEETLRRWEAVRDRFPGKAIGYAGVGATLKTIGRLDEAEAVLAAAVSRFPDDQNLAVNRAWVAVAREDWPEALRQWQALRARYPADASVGAGLEQALWHLRLAAVDDHAAGRTSDAVPALGPEPISGDDPGSDRARVRDLLMGFESLGENCELGFVQRHFGAEPLGLLRWAGIPYAKLIEALSTGFAGVGDPENTLLSVDPVNREYATADTRFDMRMHTFIFEKKEEEQAIFEKLCRRLRYLRDKFLDDLASAEKILVFQFSAEPSQAEMLALHAALRRYGQNILLCIRLQDDRRRAGEVEAIGEGLLVGYLDRPGFDGQRWDISFECWHAICREADRLARQSRDCLAFPETI